jgi:hypothetical protein
MFVFLGKMFHGEMFMLPRGVNYVPQGVPREIFAFPL